MPVSRLTNVVLPAPFGPIRPRTSPGSTRSDTASTAVNPPKVTPSPSATNAAPDSDAFEVR